MRRNTKKIEFVETANIARSLQRVYQTRGAVAAHRALLHALHESYAWSNIDTVRKVREALGLP